MAWIHTRAGTTALITIVFAGFFFAAGTQASAGTSATRGAAARQLLLELSESTDTRVVVRCVTQKALGTTERGKLSGRHGWAAALSPSARGTSALPSRG